jgi:ubiquinone/menaquinone biosynthesis C-methylase UbiE
MAFNETDKDEGAKKQMLDEWEKLASEDPMYWIASKKENWTLEEFYKDDNWYEKKTLLEFLTELGIKLQGKKVLDLGCGMGRIGIQFAKYGAVVFGIDISPEMIHIAQVNLAGIPNMHFQVGDGITLAQYQDRFFDFAWSYITFRHFPSRSVVQGYIKEISRVLKDGGQFLIEGGNFHGWQCFLADDIALRIGLKQTTRLKKIGLQVRPTMGITRYNAFQGVRVPKQTMIEYFQKNKLIVDKIFTYNSYDHMFYMGHKGESH